jgi:hypothetical protein
MAQLTGPIQFTGSIGNFRAYYDKSLKKYILSTKGGASKNLIMNNPAFARTRDNMNEFKACTKWSSLLRKSLLCIDHLNFSRYFSEITKLSKEIQTRDEAGVYGFRAIESSKAPHLLKTINFNRQFPFPGVIRNEFRIEFSEDKKTAVFSMPAFIPSSRFYWPTPIYSFRFYLVIAQLSDMAWSEIENCYEPVIKDLGRLTRCTISDWMVKNTSPVDILMEVSLDEPALTQPATTVIVALGIEVAKGVTGGCAYIEPGNGTMAIVECFVS